MHMWLLSVVNILYTVAWDAMVFYSLHNSRELRSVSNLLLLSIYLIRWNPPLIRSGSRQNASSFSLLAHCCGKWAQSHSNSWVATSVWEYEYRSFPTVSWGFSKCTIIFHISILCPPQGETLAEAWHCYFCEDGVVVFTMQETTPGAVLAIVWCQQTETGWWDEILIVKLLKLEPCSVWVFDWIHWFLICCSWCCLTPTVSLSLPLLCVFQKWQLWKHKWWCLFVGAS